MVTDFLLTVAAWLWLYRRSIVELVGLTLIVAAAWFTDPVLGILSAGIALIVAANFAGRTTPV